MYRCHASYTVIDNHRSHAFYTVTDKHRDHSSFPTTEVRGHAYFSRTDSYGSHSSIRTWDREDVSFQHINTESDANTLNLPAFIKTRKCFPEQKHITKKIKPAGGEIKNTI